MKSVIYVDESNTGCYYEHFTCEQGSNLFQALQAHGFRLAGAVCAGAGICRGCMVTIAEEGMECLACKYIIRSESLHVSLGVGNPNQHILLLSNQEPEDTSIVNLKKNHTETSYGIAYDIGTTTIASALVELATGQVVAEAGCINHQSGYGADVVSRIQYTCEQENGLSTLREILYSDLKSLYEHYLQEGYSKESIEHIAISGNTTMLHILRGLSLQGMSGYPFTPVTLDAYTGQYEGMQITLTPARSAYIGGDITAGAAYLQLGQQDSYDLLLDLGTNGELCLLNNQRGVCTSTACGPAFVGSVMNGKAHGSGLLDILAEHYQQGDLDATGLLTDQYFETGIIAREYVITQETIRQIQLAKAAIRTGIELAAYELRIPIDEIAHVYLAGGFGFHLNLESAYILGLLPEEFRGKIKIVGNTSLAGAAALLRDKHAIDNCSHVLEKCKVLDLSMNKNFQEFFVHRINFP